MNYNRWLGQNWLGSHHLLRIFIGVFLIQQVAPATVINVPAHYPLIQIALDVALPGDTVLISPGIYGEALIAPSIPFTLIGRSIEDSSELGLPTIDPSLTPDSVRRGALLIPESSTCRITNIRFINSRSIHNRTPVGGISNYSQVLSISHCVFDSVFRAFWQPNDLISVVSFDSCTFREDSAGCIQASRGRLTIHFCTFSGYGYSQVSAGEGSWIEGCSFSNGNAYLLLTSGTVNINGCTFSSSIEHPWSPIYLRNFRGEISDCLFSHVSSVTSALFVESIPSDSARIVNNIFDSCLTECLQFSCNGGATGCFAHIEGNLFIDGGVEFGAKAVGVSAAVNISRCIFSNMAPSNLAAVRVWQGETIAFENQFLENGLALQNHQSDTIDARFNYWGDSTGPYHATENPNGQGDEVRGNVLFSPWSPDTNFLALPEFNAPLPREFTLRVFPNPFNAQTTIQFEVPTAGIYSVALFDITGRQVRELFKGPAIYRETIRFSADHIASGIYFARVWDVINRRPLATAKLALLK